MAELSTTGQRGQSLLSERRSYILSLVHLSAPLTNLMILKEDATSSWGYLNNPHYRLILGRFENSSFMAAWGANQQDIHEFLQVFLLRLRPPGMNLHWQRTFVKGTQEKVADAGAIYAPPTLSAIDGKEQVELQDLISSWNGYMGMNTSFTRSSKIQCLHLDRLTTDSGAPLQIPWKLKIPEPSRPRKRASRFTWNTALWEALSIEGGTTRDAFRLSAGIWMACLR